MIIKDPYDEVRQYMFDKSIIAVMKQGKPALHNTDECAYRGDKGSKCALGHLLKDKYYSPAMEGQSPSDSVIINALLLSLPKKFGNMSRFVHRSDFKEFVNQLQEIHDSDTDSVDWLEGMYEQAIDFATDEELDTEKVSAKYKELYGS